jgi:5-(aminomethyl)-3-furanmethanol phosphate kinase
MPQHSQQTDAAAPLVVKLGGSLWRSPLRAAWIEALKAWPGPRLLVPGGGPFADAIRVAQPQMGFSMNAAHGMAMLAMEQYALALADLHEGLEPVISLDAARAAQAQGRIAVWRPFAMAQGAEGVAPSWDVTSDSLSAWLAKQAGARALLLIKSADLEENACATQSGLVDRAFAAYVEGLNVFIAGPKSLDGAAATLRSGRLPGVSIAGETAS